jgi:hypothetical protein
MLSYMILSKRQRKLWTVLVIVSSVALVAMAFVPYLLYYR